MNRQLIHIGISIVLIAAISTVLILHPDNNEDQAVSVENIAIENTNESVGLATDRIIYRGDPPYLTEQAILDGNLYVNHVDDYLLLGGENIEQVRFSAGTLSGERATVDYRENAISFVMEEQPYIEFSYQDKVYSLQILSRPYFYTMDFREISSNPDRFTEGFR